MHLVNNRRAKQYEVQLVRLWLEKESALSSIGSLETPTFNPIASPPIEPLHLITTLIGMAKYAARTGDPMPPLNIPKSCQPIALQSLENLGFQILQANPPIRLAHPILYGPHLADPPLDRPSSAAISNATRPLLLALQEAQFQEQFRSQNPER